jgi:Fe-S cluster biogenesis protein NfuA
MELTTICHIAFFNRKSYNNNERFRHRRKEYSTMQEQVQEILDKLRPYIQRDGGDVELVEVEDGIVRVRLLGACGSCPSSTITLKAGIERALMEEIPEIREVEQVL